MVRILLVDDEPFIVQGLKAMLEQGNQNCEIVGEASNGKEALDFLKQREVDLVIADIQMPVMSGLELLETIRKEKISDAYFVILSGYSDFQYAQQALRYKTMDYVLKPVKQEELEHIIAQVENLNRKKRRRRRRNSAGSRWYFREAFRQCLTERPTVGFYSILKIIWSFPEEFVMWNWNRNRQRIEKNQI